MSVSGNGSQRGPSQFWYLAGSWVAAARRSTLAAVLAPAVAAAQAPFVTDDAGVSDHRHWHVEFYQQYARLTPLDTPAVRQHTFVISAMYGIAHGVEVGFDFPLLVIENGGLPNAAGPGDLNLVAKFALRDEPPTGWTPAVSASLQVELPTGDPSQQLGSGVPDVVGTLIVERAASDRIVLRANIGAILTGNSLTGVVGIRTRGVIGFAAGAVGVQVHPRVQLLGELSVAQGRYDDNRDRELRAQVGGWFSVTQQALVGISYQAGWYATPRHQVQVGVAIDY
jgi:hypothetical protein